MFDRIAQWQPDQGAAAAARSVSALALAALAVIHVVDLPGTLGPTPLVGIGYLGIIVASVLIGGMLIARPHPLVWAATGAVAASAMGFAGRHIPHRAPRRTAGDTEPVMPADARRGPAPAASRVPAGGELANLLHRTGRPPPAFTAELHRWVDDEAYLAVIEEFRGALPPWLDGILGPDALWDALEEYDPEDSSEHQTAGLRVAAPGRYRIDYRTGNWRTRCAAVACDGANTRRIFANRVAIGPARPLTDDIARLVDPAWLLSTWRLSTAGTATVAGRPGVRIVAEPARGLVAAGGFAVVEVIVDAELGVLLQHTSFAGERPVVRTELRNLAPTGDQAAGFGADAAPGLREVPDEVREAADGMGLGPGQRLLRVELPLALPAVIAGVRIATVTVISLATVASLVDDQGLGVPILSAISDNVFKTELISAGALAVLLALVADGLLVLLQRRLTPWARSA